MDERTARREALFHAALDLSPAERSDFLDRECAGDATLREEMDELLSHHRDADADLLDAPVFAPIGEHEEKVPLSVGPYRIIRQIGQGGMGIVYEAEQEHPTRRIAIKVLRPGLYGEMRLRRFRLECDVLGQLSHPGIAHVYDAGTATVTFDDAPEVNLPYMAMELVAGRHLIDHVNEVQLDRRGRLELFARICDAVDHAHQQAVIHRDLKPSNVLVGEDGQPKLLDFGVARVAGGEGGVTRQTRTGDIIGTLQYMSPEQLLGDRGLVDVRSDVYSLGVILYQLLTGALPHGDTESLTDMIRLMDRAEPSHPSRLDGTLRGNLDAITAMALAPKPTDRYASAAALADDVRRHLRGEPVTARGERVQDTLRRLARRHRTAASVAVTIAVLVSISSIVAWTLFTRAQEARAHAEERLWESYLSRASLERGSGTRGRRLDSLENLRLAAEIRPSIEVRDGVIASLALTDVELVATGPATPYVSATGLSRTDRVASSTENGVTRVLRVPDLTETMRLEGPPHPVHVQIFSPDGRFLSAKYHALRYRQEDVQLWIWDLSTGEPALRLDTGEATGSGVAYGSSPSLGSWVAVTQADGQVHLYAMPSGAALHTLGPGLDIQDIALAPDERRLAAVSREGELVIWEVESGAHAGVTRLPMIPIRITWISEETMLVGGRDGRIHEWSIGSGETRRVFAGHQAEVTKVQPSRDGALLVSTGWDNTTRLWDFPAGRQLLEPFHREKLQGVGDYMITTLDREMRVYRYVPSLECRRITTDAAFVPPATLSFGAGGALLVTTDLRTGVRVWDLAGGERRLTLPGTAYRFASTLDDGAAVRLLTFESNGLLSWPLTLSASAATPGRPDTLWTDEGLNHGSACLNVSTTRALVTSPRGSVLLDPRTREHLLTLPGHAGVAAPALAPDGRWAFTGKWRHGAAQVWDLESGAVVAEHDAISVAGAFSPDGRLLLVCDGPTMTAYDVGSWNIRYVVDDTGRGPGAEQPAFSPDGRTVALAGTYDVRLYASGTGERLATLTPPDLLSVSAFGFSPDGGTLAALMRDRVIYLWDLERIRSRLGAWGLDWE